MRNAIFHKAAARAPGWTWEDLYHEGYPNPRIHPKKDPGHLILGDLLAYLFQYTAWDLQRFPVSQQDAELSQQKLPDPMYPHNFEFDQVSCWLASNLSTLAYGRPDRCETERMRYIVGHFCACVSQYFVTSSVHR